MNTSALLQPRDGIAGLALSGYERREPSIAVDGDSRRFVGCHNIVSCCRIPATLHGACTSIGSDHHDNCTNPHQCQQDVFGLGVEQSPWTSFQYERARLAVRQYLVQAEQPRSIRPPVVGPDSCGMPGTAKTRTNRRSAAVNAAARIRQVRTRHARRLRALANDAFRYRQQRAAGGTIPADPFVDHRQLHKMAPR